MSTTLQLEPTNDRDELLDQFRALTEPHTSSAQALGDYSRGRHVDGDNIHKEVGVEEHLPDGEHEGIEPFWRYLARCERKGKTVARYPSALLAPLLHLSGRELDVLEEIDTTWRPETIHTQHPAFEDTRDLRAKVLEWVAADDGSRLPANADAGETVDALVDKGTDIQIHGEPGSGKSTAALAIAIWLMQLNNETVVWADTLDDSGTNERAEWLALAPWATLALPAGHTVEARLAPEHHALADIPLDLDDVARDVIRYDSPLDLVEQLEPGQFYVVFPDPHHKGAEDVSQWRYWPPEAATARDEEGPDQPTPADQWWFAFIAARIAHDKFLHPTTLILDEAGNVLDPDARKDVHDTYQKCKWFKNKFADARKKAFSFVTMTHSISELFPSYRQKQRWFLTPGGSSPPIGKTLPGDKSCPMTKDYCSDMDPGTGQAWKANGGYANIAWPNIKGKYQLDAELSLDFTNLGEVHR